MRDTDVDVVKELSVTDSEGLEVTGWEALVLRDTLAVGLGVEVREGVGETVGLGRDQEGVEV